MIDVAVTIEGTVDSVARVRSDARVIWLDLVRDVEAVDVHEAALYTQVGIERLVKVHLHLEVTGLDAVDRVGTWTERVQFVQLLAANVVRLVAERVRNGLSDTSVTVDPTRRRRRQKKKTMKRGVHNMKWMMIERENVIMQCNVISKMGRNKY